MRGDPAGLLFAGFDGLAAGDAGPAALLHEGVGGFVIFKRNVQSPAQVRALIDGLGDTLVAVDQEGGRVARLREPLTVWPPMRAVGLRGSETARAVGRAIGAELRTIGFDIDFAPVLDVNSHAGNPVIGDRAFGEDAETVRRTAIPLALGLQDAGIAACGKHFPGHGHVDADSHDVLPVCPLRGADLDAHREIFRGAISAGIASLMTAHVVYPEIDEAPATLSRRWVDGVIRNQWAWDGVVFTDDLEMGALSAGFDDFGSIAVRAVEAGCDGLLVCRSLPRAMAAARALRSRADTDGGFASRCEQSLRRLAALRARFPRTFGAIADAALSPPAHRALAASFDGSAGRSDPTRDGRGRTLD